MRLKRSIRWPNFVEQLLVNSLAVIVIWLVKDYLETYQSVSQRALILIVVVVILVALALLYERFRSEHFDVVFNRASYEEVLTAFAKEHSGTIEWITKTSIWADKLRAH